MADDAVVGPGIADKGRLIMSIKIAIEKVRRLTEYVVFDVLFKLSLWHSIEYLRVHASNPPKTCPIENIQKGACTLYMHDENRLQMVCEISRDFVCGTLYRSQRRQH